MKAHQAKLWAVITGAAVVATMWMTSGGAATADTQLSPLELAQAQKANCQLLVTKATSGAQRTRAQQCVTDQTTIINALTATPTPTNTTTGTPGPTATITPTSTATSSPTSTPSATPTPTSTPTPPPNDEWALVRANAGTKGTLTPMACPSGGELQLTQDGQVLQNVDLGRCGIRVAAHNVIVRNVKAHSTSDAGFLLIVQDGMSASISDVEFYGEDLTFGSVEYSVFAPGNASATITRSNFHHCSDCVQGDHVTMTESYVHDMAFIVGITHADAFLCNASCGVVLRHNVFEQKTDNNMGVALFCDFGTPSGSVIDNNLIDMGGGGSYAIWACGKNHQITNNTVVPAFFGWLGIPSGSGAGNVISGNHTPNGTPLN